jgi:hypothetical protein
MLNPYDGINQFDNLCSIDSPNAGAEIPIAFGMSLAQHKIALQRFTNLDPTIQQDISNYLLERNSEIDENSKINQIIQGLEEE